MPAVASLPATLMVSAWLYQPLLSAGRLGLAVAVGGVESYLSGRFAVPTLPALSVQVPLTVALVVVRAVADRCGAGVEAGGGVAAGEADGEWVVVPAVGVRGSAGGCGRGGRCRVVLEGQAGGGDVARVVGAGAADGGARVVRAVADRCGAGVEAGGGVAAGEADGEWVVVPAVGVRGSARARRRRRRCLVDLERSAYRHSLRPVDVRSGARERRPRRIGRESLGVAPTRVGGARDVPVDGDVARVPVVRTERPGDHGVDGDGVGCAGGARHGNKTRRRHDDERELQHLFPETDSAKQRRHPWFSTPQRCGRCADATSLS